MSRLSHSSFNTLIYNDSSSDDEVATVPNSIQSVEQAERAALEHAELEQAELEQAELEQAELEQAADYEDSISDIESVSSSESSSSESDVSEIESVESDNNIYVRIKRPRRNSSDTYMTGDSIETYMTDMEGGFKRPKTAALKKASLKKASKRSALKKASLKKASKRSALKKASRKKASKRSAIKGASKRSALRGASLKKVSASKNRPTKKMSSKGRTKKAAK